MRWTNSASSGGGLWPNPEYLYEVSNTNILGWGSLISRLRLFVGWFDYRLSFDFENMELTIYHNGFKADTLRLESKALTPAISLRYKYEQIEIIKCGLRLHG